MEEFKEEVEIVEEEDNEPPEVRKSILPDPGPRPPTTAVSVRGGGRDERRKTEGTISATLGAMVPLVGKLDMLLAPQGRSSKRVKDVIRLLKADVEDISTYLAEMSEVEDPPATAMCWMNEARDLSYDMDDYFHNSYERAEDPSIVSKTTSALCKLTSRVKTPKRLVRTVSEFRMHVQEAIQRRQVYGLSDSGPSSVSTLRPRFVSVGPMLPTPYEETAEIVIDGRMNDFITSLAKDVDQQLKVVSVFGSACLGKTTLARVWYNRYAKQYNCRAFIRVSRKPDMRRIFRDLLSQLQGQHPPKDCKEIDLIDNIKKYLQDKRYLIIIDDLCTASAWNIINQAFPKGSHGSRIAITTQIEDVALTCCSYQSEQVFEMKPLDEDHSRKLFFNRLFGSESYCPQQLKEILTEIVEICGGLPLATVSIASLLASQPVITVDHLTYIYQSLSSCFSANSTSERMRQVLNLSYNNLPHHLKTCLLYLSMYPEGSTLYKDDLVKQWMAEVIINTAEVQDIKEVATSYLDELIGRRFIQPICINYNNELVSFAVHDAVHDLIAHKSAEMNFIVAIDYSQMNVALSRKVRRLSLLFGDARHAKTPANIRKPQIRSLTFFGFLECMPCITEFKLLCVLNLQLSDHGSDDDPVDLASLSELFKLRYLKVASYVCIKLPKNGLECLETLDIMDARVAMDGGVPCVPYIHLPHLLHLCLSDEINLLHWIENLVLDGKLNYLQDLHITTSSTSDFHSLMCLIKSSHHKLKTIVVRAGSSVKNAVVRVANQIAPIWYDVMIPPLLQRFEFVTQGRVVFSRIPRSFEKHDSLCILKIEVRNLEISCVDILRGLPALTALSLYVHTAPCQRIMVDKDGFSVLKYFKLRFTTGIAWLKFEADAMPNLWKLKLVFDAIPQMDKNLVLFPNRPLFEPHKRGTAVISIEHMPGLKEISVKFGGALADVEYASKVGVSNHPSNPTINKQAVNYSCYDDERSKLKQQLDEILVEEQDEYEQKQPDEYYKQPDKILEEEPDEYYKRQPDEILEEEPNEYYKHQQDEYYKHQPDEILEEEPNEYYKHQPDENLDEEPDEYYKQLPDDNLDEEPDEYYKQLPDDNLDEEPGEHKKTLEIRSASPSISSSPESSPRPHFSDAQGHIGIVDLLLETDASLARIARNNGKTVLHSAVRMGHVEVVASLLNKDPEIGFRTDKKGQTALHMAAKGQNAEILLELLKPNVSVIHLEDNKGNRPLHVATRKGNTIMVQNLISIDEIDINAVNRAGETAFAIAEKQGNEELVNILREVGGVIAKEQVNPPKSAKQLKQTVSDIKHDVQSQIKQTRQTKMHVHKIKKRIQKLHTGGLNNAINSETVVAVLIATVAFASIFTIPGNFLEELDKAPEPDMTLGQALIASKPGFIIFLVFDSLALFISLAVVVVQTSLIVVEQKAKQKMVFVMNKLMWLACLCISAAFIALTYVVVGRNDEWLAWCTMAIGTVIMLSTIGYMCYCIGTHRMEEKSLRRIKRSSMSF